MDVEPYFIENVNFCPGYWYSDFARSAKSVILFAEKRVIAGHKRSCEATDRFQRLMGTTHRKLSFPTVTASLLLIFWVLALDRREKKMDQRKLICEKHLGCSEATFRWYCPSSRYACRGSSGSTCWAHFMLTYVDLAENQARASRKIT